MNVTARLRRSTAMLGASALILGGTAVVTADAASAAPRQVAYAARCSPTTSEGPVGFRKKWTLLEDAPSKCRYLYEEFQFGLRTYHSAYTLFKTKMNCGSYMQVKCAITDEKER